MIHFGEARLRSNPHFRLIPFDRLGATERHTFDSLTQEPDFYGILVPPTGSVLPVKSVSRDAALLFLTLHEPASVPHLLTNLFAAGAEDRMRELVLDGIFEVEQAGKFVSGPAALSLLGGSVADASASRVAQLSLDAIGYAVALEGLSPSELAAHLYMFNRSPNTRQLQRQFSEDDRLIAYLVEGSAVAKQLEIGWTREISQDAWLMWRRASRDSSPGPSQNFKLYVSPTLENLPQAFQIAVDSFVQVKCGHFKVGRTSYGLLRPDKFVAYFGSLEQLREAAELIRASAGGVAAQGVPFTAAIDSDALVSWGMDPPRFEQVLAWQAHQSWRQWVTERIAVYTLAAKEAGIEHIPDFVLQRVALDGIDTATWTPNLAIWRGRAGREEEVA